MNFRNGCNKRDKNTLFEYSKIRYFFRYLIFAICEIISFPERNGDSMSELWFSMDIDDATIQNKIAYVQTLLKQQTQADWQDPTTFHITLDYIGDTDNDSELVVEAMKMYEKEIVFNKPVLIANKINYFDKVVWMGVDNSMPLYQIHYALEQNLKEVGYQKPESKFASYTPHITLAYNTVNTEANVDFEPFEIPITNITLWNSFKCNGSYIENYLYKIRL